MLEKKNKLLTIPPWVHVSQEHPESIAAIMSTYGGNACISNCWDTEADWNGGSEGLLDVYEMIAVDFHGSGCKPH